MTSVKVAEDAVSPFGFKLASVNSSLTGSTVTQSGPPNAYTVDLGATNPNDGDTIQYHFSLPDGTSETDADVAPQALDIHQGLSGLIGSRIDVGCVGIGTDVNRSLLMNMLTTQAAR